MTDSGPQDTLSAAKVRKDRGRSHAAARKIVLTVVGGAVTLVGIAMMVLPGPGLIVIVLGLWILAQEFDWAERRLDKIQGKAMEAVQASGASMLKTGVAVLGATSMIVGGILYGLNEDWPYSTWSTAGTIVGSGVIAAGTAIWARWDYNKRQRNAG
ncbi:MAG: PGPGW domain-containing protein [Sporichthyaceae bacterium]